MARPSEIAKSAYSSRVIWVRSTPLSFARWASSHWASHPALGATPVAFGAPAGLGLLDPATGLAAAGLVLAEAAVAALAAAAFRYSRARSYLLSRRFKASSSAAAASGSLSKMLSTCSKESSSSRPASAKAFSEKRRSSSGFSKPFAVFFLLWSVSRTKSPSSRVNRPTTCLTFSEASDSKSRSTCAGSAASGVIGACGSAPSSGTRTSAVGCG